MTDISFGLLAYDCIFWLFTFFSKKDIDLLIEQHSKGDFDQKLDRTIEIILDKLAIKNGEVRKALKDFLKSPEVSAIIKQVFSAILLGEKDKYIRNIEKEFQSLMSYHLGLEEKKIDEFAKHLFDHYIEQIEYLFSEMSELREFSDVGKFDRLILNQILNEVANINKNIEFLSTSQTSIEDIRKFEIRYREQVKNRFRYIRPPYYDQSRRVPIDDIYVCPGFNKILFQKKDKDDDSDHLDPIDLTNFSKIFFRCVILGNPGAGKSTLAQKFAYDIANQSSEDISVQNGLIPILVVLRDFGIERNKNKISIINYIETISNSNFQTKPPAGAFEYILLNNHAIVIFDGLDELLDTKFRQEITEDIESFCNLYPSVRVLVTSRSIGYEQAPIDVNEFEKYEILPFEKSQISEYANKWFNLDTDIPIQERDKTINSFLKESEIVPDLISNPLMLSLICNIYRGETYIPKNKPEVYEKCSVMLYERWDKTRGLKKTLPFEVHFEPLLMFLAYWIYSDQKLQNGVLEKDLINKSIEYLMSKRFDQLEDADFAAKEYISLCKGRAWVFTDVGTTKNGESIYKFTHRTFLEYFSAKCLARNYSTPKSLFTILKKRIEKEEWDVVNQLALQILNTNVEDGADIFINMILDNLPTDKQLAYNSISFILRCLKFITPSPNTIKKIVKISIAFIWEVASNELEQRSQEKISPLHLREEIFSFDNIFSVSEENFPLLKRIFFEVIEEYLKTGSEYEKAYCFDLLGFPPFGVKEWHQPFQDTIEKHINLLTKDFVEKFPFLLPQSIFNECFTIGKIQTENQYYFKNIESLTASNYSTIAIFSALLSSALDINENRSQISIRIAENNLSQLTIDLFSDVDYWDCSFLKILDFKKGKKFVYQSFSGDAIFGLFLLLSVLSDNLKNKERIKVLQDREIVDFVINKKNNISECLGFAERHRFNQDKTEYIMKWISGGVVSPKIKIF